VGFIASFLPWYTINLEFGGVTVASASASGWHSFLSWFSMLLLLGAAGLVFAQTTGTQVNLPVPTAVAALGLSVLAFLLILLRWVTLQTGVGAGFGLYLGLICAIVAGVASFMTFRSAGGDFRQLRQTPGSTPPPVV
jgi:hypothetical protein